MSCGRGPTPSPRGLGKTSGQSWGHRPARAARSCRGTRTEWGMTEIEAKAAPTDDKLRGEYYTPAPIAEFAPTVEPQGRWTLVRTVEPEIIIRSVERFLNLQPDGQARPGGRERSWTSASTTSKPTRSRAVTSNFPACNWATTWRRGACCEALPTSSAKQTRHTTWRPSTSLKTRTRCCAASTPTIAVQIPADGCLDSGQVGALGPSVDRDQFDPRHAAFVQ